MARQALDATDWRILTLVAEDARRSASEVGRLVNLSPAAAKRRIDRLEELGVITGYHAAVNHDRLGTAIEAFVELRFAAHTQVDEISLAFEPLVELVEGFTIAGDTDALVRLRVSDLDHLKRVIDKIRRSERVAGTKTLIVLDVVRGPALDGLDESHRPAET